MSRSTGQETQPLTRDEIAEQASKPDHDQIYRQSHGRDDMTVDRDDRADSPQESEEQKHQVEKEARGNDRQ